MSLQQLYIQVKTLAGNFFIFAILYLKKIKKILSLLIHI